MHVDCRKIISLPETRTAIADSLAEPIRESVLAGTTEAGDEVLLMKDLATDGSSKPGFAQAIRETGAHCAHAATVSNCGLFPTAIRRPADAGASLHELCGMRDVAVAVEARGALAGEALHAMRGFRGGSRGLARHGKRIETPPQAPSRAAAARYEAKDKFRARAFHKILLMRYMAFSRKNTWNAPEKIHFAFAAAN